MLTPTFAGTFALASAMICVDPRRQSSLVSSTFVADNRLPETVTVINSVASRQSRGPVTVPTVGGVYTCAFPIQIGYLKHVDVVLGRDWLAACCIDILQNSLPDPPVDQRARLPTGFTWSERSTCKISLAAKLLRLTICF